MFGLSTEHLVVLGIVVLLFGSRKIPELGMSLGQGMRAFKDGLAGRTVETKEPPLLDVRKPEV